MSRIPITSDSVVGLDVGRSGVKIAFEVNKETKTFFIPSVVVPAKHITFDTNARQTEENTVHVNGQAYFVGETAIEQGAQQTVGLSDKWLEGYEHQALLLRCKNLFSSYGITPKLIVAGLPINTYNAYETLLQKQIADLFNCIVYAVPQPYGVLQYYILNPNGYLKQSHAQFGNGRYGIIDVGHFTTDILLMSNGNWIQESSSSTIGMNKACSELQSLLAEQRTNVSLLECQNIIITGRLKEYGRVRDVSDLVARAVESTTQEIVQACINLLGTQARTMDHILVAGGGAASVADHLKKQWIQTEVVPQPRESVCLGMRRFGIHQSLQM